MSQSHREAFPGQYTHELCGQVVTTTAGEAITVSRVVSTRFGMMAIPEGQPKQGYLVNTLQIEEA